MLLGKPQAPPPCYRVALVTWLGVLLTLPILEYLLVPLLSEFPVLLQQLIITGFSVVLLAYFVIPHLTQLFYKWLYSSL
ncbi:hypothetical protein [Leptolyngbya sp. FACHB-711]|uniref:hypothetical protein n=1 Tax=unclassified Leptolyngbya TaxID=2650499 RepID=UPI0018EF4F33|nr:hypothetical protein [Leptolyngbya sp. FACHB-711]